MTTPVSHALGSESPGMKVVLGDRVFTARPFNQRAKGAFEEWVQDRAARPFLALSGGNPEAFARAVEIVADRAAEGRYAFHGELAQKAMKTPDGTITLVAIVFGCSQDDAMELMAQKGPETAAILAFVLRQSFGSAAPKVGPDGGGTDPNAPGPAA